MNFTLSFLLLFLPQSSLFAKSISGVVQLMGSSFNRKTVLTQVNPPINGKSEVKLCKSDQTELLSQLTSMTVEAGGEWVTKISKRTKKKKVCFKPLEFKVIRVSSGRDAIVGLLVISENGVYSIHTEQRKIILSRVSKGLKKLVGKTVIIDAIQIKQNKKLDLKIISYAEFPI